MYVDAGGLVECGSVWGSLLNLSGIQPHTCLWGLLFRPFVCSGRNYRKRIQQYFAFVHFINHRSKHIAGSPLRALEGVQWGLKVNLYQFHSRSSDCGGSSSILMSWASALAGWKSSVLHAQRATSLPHWKVMMVLESSMGNVKGAITMMKITNDYMAGCGGLRTLYLVGCG